MTHSLAISFQVHSGMAEQYGGLGNRDVTGRRRILTALWRHGTSYSERHVTKTGGSSS